MIMAEIRANNDKGFSMASDATASNEPMTTVVEFQIRTETTSMDEWLDEWAVRADDAT